MYNHTLIVASYCLQVFRTEEILKSHNKDTRKLMTNKELQCLEKVNLLNSKITKVTIHKLCRFWKAISKRVLQRQIPKAYCL